jgi:DNA repair exonuclease SbcCD nuclease subunit
MTVAATVDYANDLSYAMIHGATLDDLNLNLGGLDGIVTSIEGKKIVFVPWNHELPDGKFDHIFGHFEIQTFQMNNYKFCDHGLKVMDFLASRTTNFWSGHFHTKSIKKYNEGTIRYIGNTFHHDFNDCGDDKGYHILNLEDDSVEFVKNTASPEFIKIPLTKIKNYKAEDIEGNIIKLIVDKDIEDDKVEKFKVYLSNFAPFRLTTEYNVATKTIGDVEQSSARQPQRQKNAHYGS